jgi:hypothetical protein
MKPDIACFGFAVSVKTAARKELNDEMLFGEPYLLQPYKTMQEKQALRAVNHCPCWSSSKP